MGMPKTKNKAIEFCCLKCGKVLAKKSVVGHFEIKCHRCGTLNPLLHKIPQQIIITDPSGVVLHMNEAAERATGYSSTESIGKRISDLWGGQMPKAFYKKMWNTVRKKKEKYRVSLTNKKKNGEIYEVDLTIFPILDSTDNIIFYIGMEMKK